VGYHNDCAYIEFQEAINNCQSYEIGAYLFQIKDGIEYPITFIRKVLKKEQLWWTTPEKEAYAIYYAFVKLEYLIRDTHFTLRTITGI